MLQGPVFEPMNKTGGIVSASLLYLRAAVSYYAAIAVITCWAMPPHESRPVDTLMVGSTEQATCLLLTLQHSVQNFSSPWFRNSEGNVHQQQCALESAAKAKLTVVAFVYLGGAAEMVVTGSLQAAGAPPPPPL